MAWHGLKEGDEIEVEIKSIARDGCGVGRIKGCIVFVEGASKGQKVKARITKLSARSCRAVAETGSTQGQGKG